MQQPPDPDPSNPEPALFPITRANILNAPLRFVDVGSVRVDEFEAMSILGVEQRSPILRWRNEQNHPPQEPSYWRDPDEFQHTYSARGLDFRHWYNESRAANQIMDELVAQRNGQLVAHGLERWPYRQSPSLLMPWPPERMLNVQALLTRHLARWTLHSDSVGPGFPHGLPASGLSGELRQPGRAAYDAEQSQSIVLRAPQHEDFGAFLRGKILRSTSIAAARAEVFGPANLSPEVRERLEREFEWYMPLTAGTQRAIGDVGLHSIVNELMHADPDGREIPYERGGRWLRPEDRHLTGLPLDKLSTQGRAQQLLVTVVWEDGEEYEPMMHTGWYRTGPSNAQQDRDGPSWRYSLPCHRVYVRFLPAHAAPMDMAAGRAQTSDLEGPMLVNLPDGFEADVIHRAFASSTSAPREAEAGLRELRNSASFKARLEEGYWQHRGIDMQTGNGLMRHVRRGGQNPDESVVLWGHVRRSRAEPLSMYNTMPTYAEDDDELVARLSANTHCPRCPRRYPSPLSNAARDGLIFDMGSVEVPVSTARLVQPSQLDAFEQRRPVSISLSAREIGALMLGQLLHPGAPPAGEPPSPPPPVTRASGLTWVRCWRPSAGAGPRWAKRDGRSTSNRSLRTRGSSSPPRSHGPARSGARAAGRHALGALDEHGPGKRRAQAGASAARPATRSRGETSPAARGRAAVARKQTSLRCQSVRVSKVSLELRLELAFYR